MRDFVGIRQGQRPIVSNISEDYSLTPIDSLKGKSLYKAIKRRFNCYE